MTLPVTLPADGSPMILGRPDVTHLDHDDKVPLCWLAEHPQTTADEWNVSIDHDALAEPDTTTKRAAVTCPDCREWMHA